jgi:plasmid stabilization system protein ParE
MRKIIILPHAEQDIRDSVIHYAGKEEGLEKQFLSILDQTFQLISRNPFSFPCIKNPIRKFTVRDFPFNIFYIVENEHIYILAVFHNKRNPKVWKTRKRR